MTRGKVFYIENYIVYSSIEFNGDMYPDGKANDIIKAFNLGEFINIENFNNFISGFNNKHFHYDIYDNYSVINSSPLVNETIDVTNNWVDYLYIINNNEWPISIKTDSGDITLFAKDMAIVHFKECFNIIENKGTTISAIPLSKFEFIDIIDHLRDSSDLVKKVNKLFEDSRDNIENDFCNGASLQISHENIVIKLLEKIFNCSYDNTVGSDISYFIYELDYGRKYEPGMIIDGDEDVDLSSAETLYDYLIEKYGYN